MNQNFEPYKSMTPGKKVVELRKLANDFGKQPSDVDTFLAGLVDSCDCQSGFADAVLKIFEKAWKQADLKGMEMYMNLFRAFTGLEFSDFLNSAYIMATIRAQERAAEDPKEWARVGKSRAIDQKDGWFSSHWKSGFTTTSPCRVDVRTRQVIAIVPFDSSCEKDLRGLWWTADYETVEANGEQHAVQNIDIITSQNAPADVYRELLAMEKAKAYWYSASGLDFYEELIKAHKSTQVLRESRESADSDAEIVEAQFVSYWEDGEAITTRCKANLETREIIEIETSDGGVDHGFCVDENVIIEDEEFPVWNLDGVVDTEDPGELYRLLLDMKKSSMHWYSRSGLNFHKELVKARIATYPVHLCEEYCDSVTLTVEDTEHHFFEYHTDEDEVYIFNQSVKKRGKRIEGVLADVVRLFAKEQMKLNPGRWTSPEHSEN